jgi:hypothetical protein
MNKEFLRDYERKEIELQKEYYRNIKASEITRVKGYPPLSRFKKYNNPLVICDEKAYSQYGERIWSQIPFAGTLIIPLGISNKENFLRLHGFDINEIPELVKLSRETGRVEFTLNTNPTHYEGMDYLEPIFSELEPPMLTMPSNIYTSDENYDKWQEEFRNLAYPAYYHHLIHEVEEMGETEHYFRTLRLFRASIFFRLRLLNLQYGIDEVINYINSIPEYVSWLLEYYAFSTESLFNPLLANKNYTLETVNHYGAQPPSSPKRELPVEIGRFIMEKVTLHPQTSQGCINVIEHYKQNELYKLLNSLQQAVYARNKEMLLINLGDLNEILDNIWKDAKKIKNQKEGISYGKAIFLGIGGPILGYNLGDLPGLLASLGLGVAGNLIGLKETFKESLTLIR